MAIAYILPGSHYYRAMATDPALKRAYHYLDRKWHHNARDRLAAAIVIGAGLAVLAGMVWHPAYAPLVGWSSAALVYNGLTWFGIWRMNPFETKAHATEALPSTVGIHLLLVCAAFASLVGIALLIIQSPTSRTAVAVVTLLTIVASWLTIQTIYTLRYAREYYNYGGGIDFNSDENPQYSDFAYLGFTIGMSYAISDNDFNTKEFRKMALSHSLLAYLFGTVFVAALVNILASLGS